MEDLEGGGEVEAVVQKESNRVLLLDFDLITGSESSRGIRLLYEFPSVIVFSLCRSSAHVVVLGCFSY